MRNRSTNHFFLPAVTLLVVGGLIGCATGDREVPGETTSPIDEGGGTA